MRGAEEPGWAPDAATRRLSRWTLLLRQRSAQSGSFDAERTSTSPRRCSIASGAAGGGHASGDFDSGAVQLVAYTRRSSLVLLSSSMEDCAGVTGVANARESDSSPGKEASTAGASANGLLCGRSTAGARGAQFERFLEEARLRCASATEEQLADFVKKNRDSFARLLRIESCRLLLAARGCGNRIFKRGRP